MTEKNEIMDEQVNSAITEDDAFTFVQKEDDTPCENAEIDEVNLVESQGNITAENNEQLAEESTEITTAIISENTFENCISLISFEIPNHITTINNTVPVPRS